MPTGEAGDRVPRVVCKVVAQEIPAREAPELVSALQHGGRTVYQPGQKTVSPLGPLFAFATFENARQFVRRSPLKWRGWPQIWEAAAEGARFQELALSADHVVSPDKIRKFWENPDANWPVGLSRGATPQGTLVCNSITLLRRLE